MNASQVFFGTTVILVSGGLLSPQTALAQSSSVDRENQMLEEVTVTARRRDELLQRVPEQITVFDAKEIAESRIANWQDFADLTPNFQTNESFRRGVFDISIRGISTVQGGEPPITVLVDGVQASSLEFINQDLFDLQSIQVLRGPQGSTYGRGAIGGAVLITTKPPSDTFETQAQASWTSAIEEYRVNGSISGPLVENKLAVRVGANFTDSRGFQTNSFAGGYCDFVNEKVGRTQLRFTPSESLTVDAKFNYVKGYNSASCLTIATAADPYLGYGKNFPSDLPREFKQYDDRNLQESALKINWATPIGMLVSASSFGKSHSYSPGDVNFRAPPITPVFFENPVDTNAWNTNLYLVSDSQKHITWIVGGFYQKRKTFNDLIVGIGPPPISPPFFVNSNQFDLSEARAGYGEVTYKPADKLELSASLRYDEDKRESQDLNAPTSFIAATFSAVQPQGSLAYFWSSHLMTYASIGRGFRSGGFNAQADVIAENLPSARKFPAETATNYEVGFKTSGWGGRLTLNGAAFHTDFDNQQFFFVDVAHTARIVLTFPKTTINGAEVEAVLRPLERLELRGALGIADGTIKKGGQFGLDGVPSPNAYRNTFDLSAQYNVLLANSFSLRPRVEYEHRGPIYYDQFNRFHWRSTNFLNASLALEGGHWAIIGFVRNLTDEKLPTVYGVNAFGPGVNDLQQNLPRRYGVEFRVNR